MNARRNRACVLKTRQNRARVMNARKNRARMLYIRKNRAIISSRDIFTQRLSKNKFTW